MRRGIADRVSSDTAARSISLATTATAIDNGARQGSRSTSNATGTVNAHHAQSQHDHDGEPDKVTDDLHRPGR